MWLVYDFALAFGTGLGTAYFSLQLNLRFQWLLDFKAQIVEYDFRYRHCGTRDC